MNGIELIDSPSSDFDDVIEFIRDEAHLAEPTQADGEPPDAPTLHEALAGPEREQWNLAIRKELAAIKDAGTWELVDPSPAIQNLVGCRFILQKKRGSDGKVTCFKVRLVAQGFSQWEGIDFLETFAPVVKSASL